MRTCLLLEIPSSGRRLFGLRFLFEFLDLPSVRQDDIRLRRSNW